MTWITVNVVETDDDGTLLPAAHPGCFDTDALVAILPFDSAPTLYQLLLNTGDAIVVADVPMELQRLTGFTPTIKTHNDSAHN